VSIRRVLDDHVTVEGCCAGRCLTLRWLRRCHFCGTNGRATTAWTVNKGDGYHHNGPPGSSDIVEVINDDMNGSGLDRVATNTGGGSTAGPAGGSDVDVDRSPKLNGAKDTSSNPPAGGIARSHTLFHQQISLENKVAGEPCCHNPLGRCCVSFSRIFCKVFIHPIQFHSLHHTYGLVMNNNIT
jgi:hypothetical protein